MLLLKLLLLSHFPILSIITKVNFFQSLSLLSLSLSLMTPPLPSSTTGKPLNPAAESWISKDPAAGMMNQPLYPHHFFHTPPPPPYAAPMSPPYPPLYYYYPTTTTTSHFYSHYRYFSYSFPQHQKPLRPKYDGDKKVGSKAEAPPRLGGGYGGGKPKINVLRQAVPTRMVRDGKIKGGFRSCTTSNLKWKPKSCFSGNGGDEIQKGVVSSSASALKNTTVMIRNIPNKLRRHNLMSFLDSYCKDHSLEYDFIYLPIDFKRLDNLGYAFVNFTTAKAAILIMELLRNYKWGANKGFEFEQSKKICQVTWAKIQGKNELVRRFKGSSFACHTIEFLPAEFDPPRNGDRSVESTPKSIGKLKPTGPDYPNRLVQGWSKKP